MIENVVNVLNTANISPLKQLVPDVSVGDIKDDIEDFDSLLQKLLEAEEGATGISGNPYDKIDGAVKKFEQSGLDGSTLRQIVVDLVGTENANQASTNQIISGNIDNLDGAMIDMNEMNIAVQFTMQVRNKIVEAYQEIMRMQM